MKLYKQKLAPPYNSKGKTTFNVRNSPGVYMIYKNSDLRYVGFSAKDVYKALYRHFQSWEDKRQVRVTYERLAGIKVRVIYCNNSINADRLEKALIIKYKPSDNPNQYWLDYQADEKEKQILSDYIDEPQSDIIQYKKDLPF